MMKYRMQIIQILSQSLLHCSPNFVITSIQNWVSRQPHILLSGLSLKCKISVELIAILILKFPSRDSI